MDVWLKAKTFFTEEAAKRSQTLATSSAKIVDIVSETAKKSKDLATEASKKADELRAVALQQADQHLKSLSDQIPSLSLSHSSQPPSESESESELERFGITNDLRDFVKGLTSTTFQSFPVQDDSLPSDVSAVSNVRQDLSEWQQKHATFVLTTVREISRLRYELCPRHMKDRKFWRIYFTLVSTHVAPYEKKYMEEIKLKEEEQISADKVKKNLEDGETHKSEAMGTNLKSQTSTSSTAEQDLDTFLLGDLEDSDGGPGDGDGDDNDETFVDDFDKIDNLDVEDDK